MMTEAVEKVLSIIGKYKRTQLPFFFTSYVVLIPGSATACLQMHTLTSCPAKSLCSLRDCGQRTLYFRQEVPPQDDRFDLVKW